MKKFYTLAAALLATGSMLASNPAAAIKPEARNISGEAVMTEEGCAMLRAEEAYNQYVVDNDITLPGMQKFSWTDSQGEIWYANMFESGSWSDYFGSWSGDEYYARVSCTLTNNKSGSNRKLINYIMFAPKYAMWQEAYWAQLFPGETASADKMIPLKYMMAGSDIMSSNWPKGWWVPQAASSAGSFYLGGTSTTGGEEVDALVITNSTTMSTAGSPYFSASTSMGYARYNGVECGPAEGSSLQMSNFDDETSSIDLAFKGKCTNASGTAVWTYDYPFSGQAFLPGLSSKPYSFEATNIHIVKTGTVTGEDEEYGDISDTEWGPLNRFYVLAVGEGLSYDQTTLTGGETLWTSTTIPDQPVALTEDYQLNQIRGAVFAPSTSNDPNGVYKAANIEVSFLTVGGTLFGQTEGTPTEWSFLYGGWNQNYWAWSQNDGVKVTSENYYWYYPYTATNTPSITIGTNGTSLKAEGMTSLNAGFTVNAKSGLKATYHYDPTDYLKTKELDITGVNSIFNDGENNFNVEAANGNINVSVSNDALVNIYTTNGMLVKSVNAKAGQNVSVDAAKGIYLVKVGGKTVKIAL